ncbi:hypothetical protein G7K_3122-t1 [Saitoella complicata NRRL Y-17804]|uniref:Uncharacterized protein n=1 Tax=Saitoella complicata (strain BCRC 22490 / CBS 7301 / JCM 7358 / NBRC 10748 / NRRL Y-17804) TaxID=698492 RepID=A0A0E9NH17_SAICN|nr:hypothetical protein G7K_3122-t1 [Saitoella complicata NRRL Y-17804]
MPIWISASSLRHPPSCSWTVPRRSGASAASPPLGKGSNHVKTVCQSQGVGITGSPENWKFKCDCGRYESADGWNFSQTLRRLPSTNYRVLIAPQVIIARFALGPPQPFLAWFASVAQKASPFVFPTSYEIPGPRRQIRHPTIRKRWPP